MANEYTPELNAQVLDALKRKIQEEEAQRLAAVRGEASNRGLVGGSYEGTRAGRVQAGSLQAQTDAMVQMAVENAARMREERLTKEGQAYQSGEAEKGRIFSSEQADKERFFSSAEAQKAREAGASEAEIQRAFEASQARKSNRNNLINAGIGAAATTGGTLLSSKLFGAPAARGVIPGVVGPNAATLAGAAPTGMAAGPAGVPGAGGAGFGATALGVGAGLFGGGYAGQNLAKLTGKNTNEAKFGSGIGAAGGAAAGSIFGGPVGAAVGGTLGGAYGGLQTKLYQGIGKATGLNEPVNQVAGNVRRLFCFDAETLVTMADGSHKYMAAIGLGDELLVGGKVESVRVSSTADGTRYKYKGITVTGSHAVKENGTWIRVEDSIHAVPLAGDGVVYSLVTENHRIFINGLEFADEHETDFYETLSIDESLHYLNNVLVA